MIVPDDNFNIETGAGILNINGLFDSLHYYAPLDAHWLRYQMPENNQIAVVTINESLVRYVLDKTNVPFHPREKIYRQEHDAVVKGMSSFLIKSALDFEPDWEYLDSIPEGEIDEEVEDGY